MMMEYYRIIIQRFIAYDSYAFISYFCAISNLLRYLRPHIYFFRSSLIPIFGILFISPFFSSKLRYLEMISTYFYLILKRHFKSITYFCIFLHSPFSVFHLYICVFFSLKIPCSWERNDIPKRAFQNH